MFVIEKKDKDPLRLEYDKRRVKKFENTEDWAEFKPLLDKGIEDPVSFALNSKNKALWGVKAARTLYRFFDDYIKSNKLTCSAHTRKRKKTPTVILVPPGFPVPKKSERAAKRPAKGNAKRPRK